MQLLMVVIHREELLDEVLELLVELELPDAVVVETRTGLELLERDLPIFAGLRSLIPAGIDFCRVVACLVADEGVARSAVRQIRSLGREGGDSTATRNTVVLVPVGEVAFF